MWTCDLHILPHSKNYLKRRKRKRKRNKEKKKLFSLNQTFSDPPNIKRALCILLKKGPLFKHFFGSCMCIPMYLSGPLGCWIISIFRVLSMPIPNLFIRPSQLPSAIHSQLQQIEIYTNQYFHSYRKLRNLA